MQSKERITIADLSSVVPEARSIVRAAAEVYIRHTRPWFIGLILHGSALKGGFIPNCSDIDLQLYLEEAAFTQFDKLPLELCIAIHRDLAQIDTAPFQYIQCFARPPDLPVGRVPPIPGAYLVVAGRLPLPEATAEELYAAAYDSLKYLDPEPRSLSAALLDHGGQRLAWQVRLSCAWTWPVLYQVLTLQHNNPIQVWSLPKDQAIALLPRGSPLGQAMRSFYAAVESYYTKNDSVENGLALIARGVAFLRLAKAWWKENASPGSM